MSAWGGGAGVAAGVAGAVDACSGERAVNRQQQPVGRLIGSPGAGGDASPASERDHAIAAARVHRIRKSR